MLDFVGPWVDVAECLKNTCGFRQNCKKVHMPCSNEQEQYGIILEAGIRDAGAPNILERRKPPHPTLWQVQACAGGTRAPKILERVLRLQVPPLPYFCPIHQTDPFRTAYALLILERVGGHAANAPLPYCKVICFLNALLFHKTGFLANAP